MSRTPCAPAPGCANRAAVEAIVRDGPEVVRELIRLGTRFTRVPEGNEHEYDLGREGGHSHRRVLHAQDLTGQEIMRALWEAIRADPNISFYEDHLAIDLLIERRGSPDARCWGGYALDRHSGVIRKIPLPLHPARHRRGRQGLSLYDQSRYRLGRRRRDGASRRCPDRQHGVLPVPSHLPVPSRSQIVPDLRGVAGRRRNPASCPTASRS